MYEYMHISQNLLQLLWKLLHFQLVFLSLRIADVYRISFRIARNLSYFQAQKVNSATQDFPINTISKLFKAQRAQIDRNQYD